MRPRAAEVVGPYGKTGGSLKFCRGGPMWPPVSLPPGGRWHGEAVTDEGTGFGLRLLCAEGILPPGTAQDEHFVLIFAFPRTPFTGVTPLVRQKTSGAQNLSGWSQFPPGHWALAVWKIEAGAVPHLRLALPSQHARFNIRDTSSAPFGGTFP